MEAARARPVTPESLPGPASQCSVPHFDPAEDCLARIPATPSSISEPSYLEREFSLATTPTTVATEVPSDSNIVISSMQSLHKVFVVQRFHVSPSMAIDKNIQLIWTNQIRSRLSIVLLHEIPKGTCMQEFMMAGKRLNALKPTIIITCGDIETKKRVEKVFRKQEWLQRLLRANDIMFVALVERIPLSAKLILDHANAARLSEYCSVQLRDDSATTSCGLPLLVNAVEIHAQRYCTLGGLIIVNGEIFGLTAGHPFKAYPESMSIYDKLHDIGKDADVLDYEESAEDSSEPFVFNGDDSSSRGSFSTRSAASLSDDANFSSTSANATMRLLRSAKWSHPCGAIISRSAPINSDWALVEMLPHSVATLPNKIVHPDSRHSILIEKTVSRAAHGEVTIIAGIGAQPGCLHSSPATMKVNQSTLDVQLITLDRILPLGSSGAWVILGDRLCGFIAATRQDVPWAYMVPIGPILENIKQTLGTADIRLPRQGEIESFTRKYPPRDSAGWDSPAWNTQSSIVPSHVTTYDSAGWVPPAWSTQRPIVPSHVTTYQYEPSQHGSDSTHHMTDTGESVSYSMTPARENRLGDDYKWRNESFFIPGRVFGCLWSESVSERSYNETQDKRISRTFLGGLVHTNIQRFVIIRVRLEQQLSICCPIKTYGRRGIAKFNERARFEHSIIYSDEYLLARLSDEEKYNKEPIQMVPENPSIVLSGRSWLNFGRPTPVDHNLRVKFLGEINPKHFGRLLRYFDEVNGTRYSTAQRELEAYRPAQPSIAGSILEHKDEGSSEVEFGNTRRQGRAGRQRDANTALPYPPDPEVMRRPPKYSRDEQRDRSDTAPSLPAQSESLTRRAFHGRRYG